jgi:hypothetical protein
LKQAKILAAKQAQDQKPTRRVKYEATP